MNLDFQTGTDGVERCIEVAPCLFEVEIERYDREKFQKRGHFVPGMVDEGGFRREWDGPLVFAGTIWLESRDAQGKSHGRRQVLRILADTPQELMRLVGLAVRDTFFALWQAQQLQADTFERMRVAHDEHNDFVAWLRQNGILTEGQADGLTTAQLARKVIGAKV